MKGSRESHDCVNPVRSCEEKYFRDAMESRDKTKELIKLSIGEEIALVRHAEIILWSSFSFCYCHFIYYNYYCIFYTLVISVA